MKMRMKLLMNLLAFVLALVDDLIYSNSDCRLVLEGASMLTLDVITHQ
jgi:hypothetical protein